ncbi:MAG: DNA topoisomerase [Coriobacteriales bacterium]|jgi:DNA topoisomerase-3
MDADSPTPQASAATDPHAPGGEAGAAGAEGPEAREALPAQGPLALVPDGASPVATPGAAVRPAGGGAKTLVIAEKRSVGRTIAAFLGCGADHGSWVGGERFDVTWAQGHLLRLLMPDEYAEHPDWRERGTAALPLIPAPNGWRWEVSSERGAAEQYRVVEGLVRSGAYGRVVNACDPDREGQCICDLALWNMGCELPVDRLWCSSLEDAALERAFGRMRPDADYAGLYQSAVARSKADWLVGMNASRLYSCSMHAAQSVGRVRTPTLAMVVERDRAIEAFRGKDAHRVLLDLGDGLVVTGEPTADKAEAQRVLESAKGAPCTIDSVERRRSREGSPTLLNTTGAQKLASERLGMAPDEVDRVLQALYEKKLATYPRTDSKFVNSEDGAGLERLVAAVADEAHVGPEVAGAFAGMAHDVAKVVDDSKVEGHGALLPTRQLTAARLAALPQAEAAVARLLCESLLAAVAPDRVFDHTEVKATCDGLPYAASANVDVDRGWRALAAARPAGGRGARGGAEDAEEGRARIPDDLQAPCTRTVAGGEVRTTKPKPPRRFTDATLLAAMEHADRFVDEEDLKAAIKDSTTHSGGIGTPATRAGIIASLVDRGYLARKGSTLTSTPDGRALVDEVADELKSVDLTARMEKYLSAIDREGKAPGPFVSGVVTLVRRIVAHQRLQPMRTALPKGAVIGKCPACGGNVLDTGNERAPYLCENSRRERVEGPDGSVTWRDCGSCGFRLHRTYMGGAISPSAARRLLGGKSVMLRGMTRRDGTTVDRLVCLDPERGWRPRIAADQSFKVGVCPKCGGRVLDVGNERVPYLCEHNPGAHRGNRGDAATDGAGQGGGAAQEQGAPGEGACDFRLFRTFLDKRLPKADVARLLRGETVELKGLTSRRDGEKFNAYVALDPRQGYRLHITGYPAEQPRRKGRDGGGEDAGRGRGGVQGAGEAQMTLFDR